MAILVECPCGKRFQARDELAGKLARCNGCGQTLTIPHPVPPSPQNTGPASLLDDSLLDAIADAPTIERPAGATPPRSHAPDPLQRAPLEEPTPRRHRGRSTGAGKEFIAAVGSLAVGAIASIAGLIATVGSHSAADEGGTYRVFYGMIGFGLISMGYGVIGLIRAMQMKTGGASRSGEAGIDRFIKNLTLGKVLLVAIILTIVGIFVLVNVMDSQGLR
jgi:hypothetical protein